MRNYLYVVMAGNLINLDGGSSVMLCEGKDEAVHLSVTTSPFLFLTSKQRALFATSESGKRRTNNFLRSRTPRTSRTSFSRTSIYSWSLHAWTCVVKRSSCLQFYMAVLFSSAKGPNIGPTSRGHCCTLISQSGRSRRHCCGQVNFRVPHGIISAAIFVI